MASRCSIHPEQKQIATCLARPGQYPMKKAPRSLRGASQSNESTSQLVNGSTISRNPFAMALLVLLAAAAGAGIVPADLRAGLDRCALNGYLGLGIIVFLVSGVVYAGCIHLCAIGLHVAHVRTLRKFLRQCLLRLFLHRDARAQQE